MKTNKLLTIFLFLFPMSCVSAQFSGLTLNRWYDTINKISVDIKNTGQIVLKQEVFLNGKPVRVAQGRMVYTNPEGEMDTIPFIYSYGNYLMSSERYSKMIKTISDTAVARFYLSFLPIETSVRYNEDDTWKYVSYQIAMRYIKDLYSEGGNYNMLFSYLAITTMGQCYKIKCLNQTIVFSDYYIPDDFQNRKKMIRKLDRLWQKQYFDLLVFFDG